MFIVFYIYKKIFNHFLFKQATQKWLWTTDHKRFQFTSFSLREMKMFHSTCSNQQFTWYHY